MLFIYLEYWAIKGFRLKDTCFYIFCFFRNNFIAFPISEHSTNVLVPVSFTTANMIKIFRVIPKIMKKYYIEMKVTPERLQPFILKFLWQALVKKQIP